MTALRLEQVASDPNQGIIMISFVKERLKTQGGVEQVYRVGRALFLKIPIRSCLTHICCRDPP